MDGFTGRTRAQQNYWATQHAASLMGSWFGFSLVSQHPRNRRWPRKLVPKWMRLQTTLQISSDSLHISRTVGCLMCVCICTGIMISGTLVICWRYEETVPVLITLFHFRVWNHVEFFQWKKLHWILITYSGFEVVLIRLHFWLLEANFKIQAQKVSCLFTLCLEHLIESVSVTSV